MMFPEYEKFKEQQERFIAGQSVEEVKKIGEEVLKGLLHGLQPDVIYADEYKGYLDGQGPKSRQLDALKELIEGEKENDTSIRSRIGRRSHFSNSCSRGGKNKGKPFN